MINKKTFISVIYEDEPSLAVIEVLFRKRKDIEICRKISCHGYGKIKKNIHSYNAAALHNPDSAFFVLTDLDSAECPIRLISDWFQSSQPAARLMFRVAVREIESWILADFENFASFLGISQGRMPRNPDELADPKNTLFNIVSHSRKKELKEGILPIDSNANIGPLYNVIISNFIQTQWSVENAVQNSPSLAQAAKRIREWKL